MKEQHEIELRQRKENVSELCDEGTLTIEDLNIEDQEQVIIGPLKIVDDEYEEISDQTYISNGDIDSDDMESGEDELSEDRYHIYQNKDLKIHLFTSDELIREKDYVQLSRHIRFREESLEFVINGYTVKIPSGSELQISSQYIVILLPVDKGDSNYIGTYDRLVIDYAQSDLVISNDEYFIQLTQPTGLFIDQRGKVVFSYYGEIAVIDFSESTLRFRQYSITLSTDIKTIKVLKKWVNVNDLMSINGVDGVLKLSRLKLKLPPKSEINLFDDHVELSLIDNQGHIKQLNMIPYQSGIVMAYRQVSIDISKQINMFIDRKGNFVFHHDDQVVVMNLRDMQLRIGNTFVNFKYTERMEIKPRSFLIGQFLKIMPSKKTVCFDQSHWIVDHKTMITPRDQMLQVQTADKVFTILPRNKQLFIRVGGRLVIVTVTIGIALDQSGNIAFDYRGHLATLDVSQFILRIDDMFINMQDCPNISMELIGNSVIVGHQDARENVMSQLNLLLHYEGLSDILKEFSEGQITAEELIELLLSVSDVSEILSILQSSGIQINERLSMLLMKLLGNIDSSELLERISESGGVNPLLWIKNSDALHLMNIGGQVVDLSQNIDFSTAINISELAAEYLIKLKDRQLTISSLSNLVSTEQVKSQMSSH